MGINNFPNCPEKERASHSGQTRKSLKVDVKSEHVAMSTGYHLLTPEHLWLKSNENNTWSVQFSSVAQSCLTLCDPMNCSTPGLPVMLHHRLPEFTQTHVPRVGDAIQPSHLLLPPSPPAPNPSQHQSLFQWVNSSHEVAKVLEF